MIFSYIYVLYVHSSLVCCLLLFLESLYNLQYFCLIYVDFIMSGSYAVSIAKGHCMCFIMSGSYAVSIAKGHCMCFIRSGSYAVSIAKGHCMCFIRSGSYAVSIAKGHCMCFLDV